MEVGGWKTENEGWKLEIGSWKLDAFLRVSLSLYFPASQLPRLSLSVTLL